MLILSLGLSVVAAVGCGDQAVTPRQPDRLVTLERAFTLRTTDPHASAALFEQAGPGPALERARLEAWFAVLEHIGADPGQWQAFLASGPSARLADRATLGLASALADGQRRGRAAEVLLAAPESIRTQADLKLLDLGEPEVAAEAAYRLARTAPQQLRSHSRTLEREALTRFDHTDWMTRAAAWRAAGRGSRGAAELRAQKRRGDQEKQRRMELALCELDAGSSTRALSALPSESTAGPEELVLRAEAYRRRGWNRVPNRAAERSFASCFDLARRAVARSGTSVKGGALALVLECGTETGDLGDALDAWWRLEAAGWSDRRRTWLGRRLGIALALSGADPSAVAALATSLPNHQRCIDYWQAASTSNAGDLHRLSDSAVADLYGRWAGMETGAHGNRNRFSPAAEVGSVDPPASVAWLLAHGGQTEASGEWQRLLRHRRPTRSEAVAAAELAARAGRPNTAIRTLRKGFPELNSVAIADAPIDAVLAYLPLRWVDHLLMAARETRLDPWLIAAIARQESTFSAHARSPAGARGVMQLIPATARLHARALGLGRNPNLEDPETNIRLGASELRDLIRRFGALEPALAAYNAGERRVRRWWQRWPERRIFTESIPIPETYYYVRRVVFLSEGYRQAHAAQWRTSQ